MTGLPRIRANRRSSQSSQGNAPKRASPLIFRSMLFDPESDMELCVLGGMEEDDDVINPAIEKLKKQASRAGLRGWGALNGYKNSELQGLSLDEALKVERALEQMFGRENVDTSEHAPRHETSQKVWVCTIGEMDLTVGITQARLILSGWNLEGDLTALKQAMQNPISTRAFRTGGMCNALCWERAQAVGKILQQYRHENNVLSRLSLKALRYLSRLGPRLMFAAIEDVSPALERVDLAELNFEAVKKARQRSDYRFETWPGPVRWKAILPDLDFAYAPQIDKTTLRGFKPKTLMALVNEFSLDGRKQGEPRKKLDAPEAFPGQVTGDASQDSGALAVIRSFDYFVRNPGALLDPAISDLHLRQANIGAAFNLTRLFGDYATVKRFVLACGHPWTAKGLHDAGQFRLHLDSDWTPKLWAGLCLKAPKSVKHSGSFPEVEKKLGTKIPTSYNQLNREVALLNYPDCPADYVKLRDLCLKEGLSGRDFTTHLEFWKNTAVKRADYLPYVCVQGREAGLPDDWKLVKLDSDDFRGPLLGSMTGCCQHLTSLGSSSAIGGVVSPFSGFYIIEKNGKLFAQSWAWRSLAGDLVFDSWESVHEAKEVIAAFALLIQTAAKKLMEGPLGVRSVLIGNTNSGVTAEILEHTYLKKTVEASANPVDSLGYFDGRTQIVLAGKPGKRCAAMSRSVHATDYELVDKRNLLDLSLEHNLMVHNGAYRLLMEDESWRLLGENPLGHPAAVPTLEELSVMAA